MAEIFSDRHTISKNHNRPQIGSRIKTEPIRLQKDIRAIKRLLENHKRDHLLFTSASILQNALVIC